MRILVITVCSGLLWLGSAKAIALTFQFATPIASSSSTIAQVSTMPPNITNEAAIERLFTAKKVLPEWFTSTFLAQISISKIEQIISSIKTELGVYQKIEATDSEYIITFAKGKVSSKIALDTEGKIGYLLFTPVTAGIRVEDAIAQFKKLPGKVAFLVTENKSEIAALNADKPLAVASAFKLAVLDILQSQIAAKKHSWDEVVALKSTWKSLPSGMLQDWPDGSLITIQTLASLMISISDNTATDALINIVGRENIESVSDRNLPFITTRENFTLKIPNNASLLQRYLQGNTSERRDVLAQIDKAAKPDLTEFISSKINIEIEWFFTTKELCNLMEKVAPLPLMSINPGTGITNPQDWEKVAFKGGSEPGVYQLTTWLKAKTGKKYCISATWNHDQTLDEARFVELYKGVITGLKERN
ncbi:serine hydrolase [Merismopedia glauca]|nr:serine hydrolase [Merismopedia glauca]